MPLTFAKSTFTELDTDLTTRFFDIIKPPYHALRSGGFRWWTGKTSTNEAARGFV